MPNIAVTRVASPVLIDPALPGEPNLRAVADDVLAKLRYSLAAAAVEEHPAASGTLDKLFRGFLATRNTTVRARARDNARALIESTPQQRQKHFGRYGAINLKEYGTLGSDRIDTRVSALKVNVAALKDGMNKLQTQLKLGPQKTARFSELTGTNGTAKASKTQANDDLAAGKRYKKMRLFIREVRCIEETDEMGSDEISLGGTIIGATGNTVRVDQFQVSNDFDEGERRDPNRVFGRWTIRTEPQGFPYVYTAVIVMAERDDGGFHKFLQELWEAVGEKVQAALTGAVGAAIGAALGSLAGPIGAVVGAIFGMLIAWLISLFDNPDDIVGTKTVQMVLGACTESYYEWAKLTSAQGLRNTLSFNGDGGRYKVDLSWKVAHQ